MLQIASKAYEWSFVLEYHFDIFYDSQCLTSVIHKSFNQQKILFYFYTLDISFKENDRKPEKCRIFFDNLKVKISMNYIFVVALDFGLSTGGTNGINLVLLGLIEIKISFIIL